MSQKKAVKKKAVITGVTGQDGSYLAELLLSKGYIVYGIVRQSTQFTRDRWGYLKKALLAYPDQFIIKYADLNDYGSLRDLLDTVKPDEIYNLAAQSHVGQSFEQPMNTCEVTAIGALRLLEAAKKSCPGARFYQASSSEMFGKVQSTPQNESTGFHPRSPYGVAKVFAHWATVNYREAYGMYATSGILFNHESERRGEQFVTRKITRAVGRIVTGKQQTLKLGNIAAKRDWGYAPDYVEAMWLMLQQDAPSDYVIGTGKHHSVEDFLSAAFTSVNLDWKDYVEFDIDLNRPSEVDTLLADSRRAKFELGWEPKTNFRELVALMVQHDVALAKVED
jgi:GDPmannose 4,6-dehydratase